jgi:hypothetical protein
MEPPVVGIDEIEKTRHKLVRAMRAAHCAELWQACG